MNNLIYCITSVNKDILGGIKAFFVGIPNIFAMGFYEKHRVGLVALAAIIGILMGCIAVMILGVYVADTYYPDDGNMMLWMPILFIWTAFLTVLYIVALFSKCKEL